MNQTKLGSLGLLGLLGLLGTLFAVRARARAEDAALSPCYMRAVLSCCFTWHACLAKTLWVLVTCVRILCHSPCALCLCLVSCVLCPVTCVQCAVSCVLCVCLCCLSWNKGIRGSPVSERGYKKRWTCTECGWSVWKQSGVAYSNIPATDAKRRLTRRCLSVHGIARSCSCASSETRSARSRYQRTHGMAAPPPPPLPSNIWQSAKAAHAASKQQLALQPLHTASPHAHQQCHTQEHSSCFGAAQQAQLHARLLRSYAPEVCGTSTSNCKPGAPAAAAAAASRHLRTQMSGSDAHSAAGSVSSSASSSMAAAGGAAGRVRARSSAADLADAACTGGAAGTLSDAQSLHSSDAPSSPVPSRKRKAVRSVPTSSAISMQRCA